MIKLNRKMTSDVVEALICAFYLNGGLKSAVEYISKIGIVPIYSLIGKD